ncbi:kinase [Candidatus Paracaedimonas acanthamoebae]|nr:kinase [Candidatus Paracaedimonas acanthamoebae]
MNTFEQNIISIYGSRGQKWLRQLPTLVQQIAQAWDLNNLRPIETMTYNYVLSGFQKEKPVVLKLSLDEERLYKETAILKIFKNYGAVRVLNSDTHTLLLEQLIPGYSLKTYLPERKDEARLVMCQIMGRLHQAPLSQNSKTLFPSISDLLKILDKEWNIPTEYLVKARFLKDKLLNYSQSYVLLHWDLHHDNILLQDKEWVVIDPQGVIGPPVSETWAFIVDPASDTEYIASYFNYSLENVRQWYFVRLILAICWNLEDHLDPEHFLQLAERTFPLI